VKLKLPEPSAVVVAVAAPLNATVAPPPAETGLIVPEMLQVVGAACPVKLIPVWFAPFTATARLAGVNVYPDRLGVTV
jgi:hypothetical protein